MLPCANMCLSLCVCARACLTFASSHSGLKPKTHDPHRQITKEDMATALKRSETTLAAEQDTEDATLGHGITFSRCVH